MHKPLEIIMSNPCSLKGLVWEWWFLSTSNLTKRGLWSNLKGGRCSITASWNFILHCKLIKSLSNLCSRLPLFQVYGYLWNPSYINSQFEIIYWKLVRSQRDGLSAPPTLSCGWRMELKSPMIGYDLSISQANSLNTSHIPCLH